MGCRLSGPWLGDGLRVNTQDLSHMRKREALRILASYEQPITLQIEGRKGRGLQYHRTSDCSTQTECPWEPLRSLVCGPNPAPHGHYSERSYYSHMTLPGDHGDRGRCEYLPNAPRDREDLHAIPSQDPELSSRGPQEKSCLIGCCNTNMEEPSSFQSQTEDEDYIIEKVGYLPLHHELDSGLGWTDGSFQQGELSGMETEEGLEECHARRGGLGGGGSPSSESFISSELSDSGFYSVSTGEFLRFQRLLEKRMRLYNARLHHQGELCPREHRDSQKAHRELEAIPEALTVQPQNACVAVHPRGLFRVSSMQARKAEHPALNQHSSSSAALFTPHAALSTCSTPSSQRRPLPHQSSFVGMLRRSRTLHHRPVPVEHRRRASHPASPSYCSLTLHHYNHRLNHELPEELEPDMPHPAKHPPHHAKHHSHPINHPPHPSNHPSHPANQAPLLANHPTLPANHPPHHPPHTANHSMHPANHPTHTVNHHTHSANHSPHLSNHPSHPANHPPHSANLPIHPANFTTHSANHSPHISNHSTHPVNHSPHLSNHSTHPVNHSPHLSNHTTHPVNHSPHLSNHTTHPVNHSPHLSNHSTHPVNHSPHLSSHTSHSANHSPHLSNHNTHPVNHSPHLSNHSTHPGNHSPHLNNHTTHPANHSPHLSNHTTHPANHASHLSNHPTQPADIPTHHTYPTNQLTQATHPTHATMSQPSLTSSTEDHHCALLQEHHYHDNRGRTLNNLKQDGSFVTTPPRGRERECERGREEVKQGEKREREARFHTLSHTPSQSQDTNDTWPKPAARHGLYRTLEGHASAAATVSTRKLPVGSSNTRAVRNQLLRDRALRLADERSGMSTDEESHGEVRMGRYWSRTERREHMHEKQRQQHARGGGATSMGGGAGGEGGYHTLLELSQRKLSRLRNRKLLDDWTTVEELLTHGTRIGAGDETLQLTSSLLTVTTV